MLSPEAWMILNVVVKWIGKDVYSHAGNLAGLINRGEKCSVKCGCAGMKGNSCSRALHKLRNIANSRKEREHISKTVILLDYNIIFAGVLFSMPPIKVSPFNLKSNKSYFFLECWIFKQVQYGTYSFVVHMHFTYRGQTAA